MGSDSFSKGVRPHFTKESDPLSHPLSQRSLTPLQRLADAQAESLEQFGDALRLHLERVACAERAKRFRWCGPRSAERDQLGEVPLEPGRRDDLEDACRPVPRVPERVPL